MKSFPIILIGFGVGFLLYNLQVISFTPWQIVWPSLIIWLASSQLGQIKKRQRGSEDSWEIALWLIVLTVGVYLLLPIIGIPMPSIPWAVVWPLVLILIGVLILLPGKCSFIKVDVRSGGRQNSEHKSSSFLGEFNRGPTSWVLDDMDIRHGIGSVNLDLTQSIVPDRETHIDVYGYVGEASIYLPPGLPFRAECSLSLGEITVLDQKESGSHRYIRMESPGYEAATQKVNIRVHWKIGEISIRQIR
ncbi:MAG: cell wall-active antibiotics response protein LiaF [Bacillota bacterium]|jgi:predicted membrane protein|nr:cell wall-active antibiotics response protein LiaF [Bacillota bacterium]HHT91873.1 cell wall-active antibiotics response protein [Bacillota bacterium]